MKIKVGDIHNPRSGNTYRTRDVVNAVKLAKLLTSLDKWRKENELSKDKATLRHVKAIKEVL